MIPGCDKPLPEGQVGPGGLGEEGNNLGKLEHFPDGDDELLGFFGHLFVQAAHTVLKEH